MKVKTQKIVAAEYSNVKQRNMPLWHRDENNSRMLLNTVIGVA